MKTLLEIRTIIKKEEIKISLSTGSYIAPIASLLSLIFRIKYYINNTIFNDTGVPYKTIVSGDIIETAIEYKVNYSIAFVE